LVRGDAFLRLTEEHRSGKPNVERQMRVIENRASGYAELVVTVFAVVENLFGFEFDRIRIAARAACAFRPSQTREKLAALVVSGKHRVYVN
jgi:hypothetical protein